MARITTDFIPLPPRPTDDSVSTGSGSGSASGGNGDSDSSADCERSGDVNVNVNVNVDVDVVPVRRRIAEPHLLAAVLWAVRNLAASGSDHQQALLQTAVPQCLVHALRARFVYLRSRDYLYSIYMYVLCIYIHYISIMKSGKKHLRHFC